MPHRPSETHCLTPAVSVRAVNEAFNQLLIDEEDFKGLRSSIEHYDNFDQLLMAGNLQDHELIEFRRIAAFIYKRNLKWTKVRLLSLCLLTLCRPSLRHASCACAAGARRA